MPAKRNSQVDAYIARAAPFARPILEQLREAFHAGCPEIEERIKWGVPSFEYQGLLGGMAAFKRHVAFGFWKSRLMAEFEQTFGRAGGASLMRARVESLRDLPPKRVLVAMVRKAKRLNEEGIKEPRRAAARIRPQLRMPPELEAALAKHAKARAVFEAFAPSHKREYLEWITEAKRPETRARRIATTLAWLTAGKRRNWKYER